MLPPRPSPLRHSHLCLSPTYTWSVFEGRFELLRPSVRGTSSLTTHSKGLLFVVGRHITLCTYSQRWRGTARGLQLFGACTSTRTQLVDRNVPCKQCCASGLQQHVNICTEDVTAARRTLQSPQISSRETTASSSLSNPRKSANWLVFLILCLRRQHAATATVTAAT